MSEPLVDIILLNMSGEPFHVRGRIVGIITHGYNMPGGGWCLYSSNANDAPAKFLHYIPVRVRKYINRIPIERVVSIGGKKPEGGQ